jgi:mono/diheme cytochrome c family protein
MKSIILIALLATVSGSLFKTRSNHVAGHNSFTANASHLYVKHCASCHGKDGRSKTLKAKFNHARDLTKAEWQENVSDERIFNSIMNGRKKMPAYGKKLTSQEIDALVAQVRAFRK